VTRASRSDVHPLVKEASDGLRDLAEAYRAGVSDEVARRDYGVTRTKLEKLAERYGWVKNQDTLGAKVSDRTHAVVSAVAQEPEPNPVIEEARVLPSMPESLKGLSLVEIDSLRNQTRSAIVLGHRRDIGIARHLLVEMFHDLHRLSTLEQHAEMLEHIVSHGITDERDIQRLREAVRRSLSVHQRAQTLSALSKVLRELQSGERLAVGLTDSSPPPLEEDETADQRDELTIINVEANPPPMVERVG